jgi:uncharacterized protein (DUF58 family)
MAAATPSNQVEDRAESELSLLSPEMGARLNRLTLMARRLPEARRRGRRRSRQVGQGTERIDTRDYVPGDDPRRIAWTLYGRLERMLTWLVAEEEPLRLTLIVDTSASMGFGAPSKLVQATRIAAGLAAIALANDDRVAVVATSGDPAEAVRSMSSRRALPRLLAMLDRLRPRGRTDLAAVAAAAIACAGGRGLCVILSDLLDPAGALAGAQALRGRGQEVALVEVLDPFEIDPPELAGLVLEDEETGDLIELPDSGARAAYLAALAAHRAAVDEGAATIGAPVVRITTQQPFDDVVSQALGAGLMRAGTVS